MRMMGEQSKPTLFFKRRGEQAGTPVTTLVKAFLLVVLRKLGNLIFIWFFFFKIHIIVFMKSLIAYFALFP